MIDRHTGDIDTATDHSETQLYSLDSVECEWYSHDHASIQPGDGQDISIVGQEAGKNWTRMSLCDTVG